MKQDCKTILPLVAQMDDGALDADTAWKVRMHVSVCPDCARVSRGLAGMSSLLKGLPKRDLPDSFDSALAARIAQLSRSEVRRGRMAARASYVRRYYGWSLRLFAAAVAAVLLFAALVARAPTRTSPPSITPARAPSDSALIAACLRQHHSYMASDPLADPSAQSLASQVDSALNPDGGTSQNPSSSPENM
jgi:hypothetical protein